MIYKQFAKEQHFLFKYDDLIQIRPKNWQDSD